jgi:crossover junction endodeoxyribonuclease RuvC
VALATLLERHDPAEAAMEAFGFYGKAVTSSLQLANVVGMLRESLRHRGLEAAEYGTQEVKRAVAGNATADKAEIQRRVRLVLGLARVPRPEHAADALAVAITHATRTSGHRSLGIPS